MLADNGKTSHKGRCVALRCYRLPLNFVIVKRCEKVSKLKKEDAISIVTSCAEKYKNELVNRTLLFVCQDKHSRITLIEFTFDASNFMHLTGLKFSKHDAEKSPTDFFNKCVEHRLSKKDFDFAEDGTSQLKLSVLPMVINKSLSAKMIGDYNSYNPKLITDKLVGGEKACIGFVTTGNKKRYIPNTLLKGDIRNYVSKTARVIAIFRKYKSENLYTEITYKASKVDLKEINLPKDFAYLSSF